MGITLVCLARTSVAEDPTPTPWPTPFYAVLYQNFSGIIGLMDLYYDWENGRNLHLIKNQYQPIVHDMEFNNGTVLKWSTSSDCRNLDVGVGVLPPTWLKGATYLGTQKEDGFTVNVFTKADFIVYREDVVSKRPVSWTFYTGRDVHVMSFQPGYVLPEENWYVPVECFLEQEKYDLTASGFHESMDPFSETREWMISGSTSA
ncbi:hypothetical protein AXG93_4382s1170 [Marchantia polymorpha subsp. ruderalis]|nr:hypothetical protein AXG93_4382s1170 [Marchantia polymorpha subsp. ruderalis]